MNLFNRKRFAHYVKWDICNQRSKETQVFGILLLSFTLIMLMLFIDTSSVTKGMHLTAFLMSAIIIVFATFAACQSPFGSKANSTKRSRISQLMVPASMPEKFVSTYVVRPILFAAIGIIAFCLADIIQQLWAKMIGIAPQSHLPYAINRVREIVYQAGTVAQFYDKARLYAAMRGGNVADMHVFNPVIFIYSAISCLSCYACFTFFGIVFRRFAFFISLLCLGLIMVSDLYIIKHISYHLVPLTNLVCVVTLYYYAYQNYRKLQIIHGKFMNI